MPTPQTTPPQTYAYIRVSTAGQDTRAQHAVITDWQKNNARHINSWMEEKVTGSVAWRERELSRLVAAAHAGDTIVTAELSRLGRSTADVLDLVANCAAHNVSIVALKPPITLTGDLPSTIYSTVIALAAEIERDFIRARTREGIAAARARGKRIGRPPGRAKTTKLTKHHTEILRLANAGVANTAIARLLNVSRSTVSSYLSRQKTPTDPTGAQP